MKKKKKVIKKKITKKKVTKKKEQLMGMREYARSRNVELVAVQDAIRAERIPIVIVSGKKKINKKAADKAWLENTNPALARGRGTKDDDKVTGPSYHQSRATREAFQAKLAKIEYDEKVGSIIEKEKVKKDAFELARRVRDSILLIPSRIASAIAAETSPHKAENFLIKELTKALEDLTGEID